MPQQPTLRRELIGAFAIVFAGALLVAAAGIVLVVPRLAPLPATAYLITLLLADIAVFSWFGTLLLRRRLLEPLNAVVAGVEEISRGALDTPLPAVETEELARLSAAVNQMSRRLLADQQSLADNIRSLNETNRLLTEARDAMIHTEKMASVGRLGAGIAHEVGNPLGAILGYLGLLARQEDGPRREMALAAEREAQRIDRIIRGLLDYARPRESVAQAVDVRQVLDDTIELLRTQGHFSLLHFHYRPGTAADLLVRGDPYQLQQVMVNLFVNAADAVADTPTPCISVQTLRRAARPAAPHTPARRREDPEGIDYSHRRRLARTLRWVAGDPASDSGDVVEIVVTDNGPGIPKDMIEHVFEPFVTTKEPGKGTGLGLALCARLVEGMGGTINADNADDGGAVFRVVLPAAPIEASAT
jgi:two-component system, NtrC family, sensor kinase